MVATRLHKASAPPEPQPSEADDPKIKKALKKLHIEAHATLVGEKPQEKNQNIQTYRWKNGVTYAVDASTKPEWIEESESRRKRLSSESRVFSRTATPLTNSNTPQNDIVGENGTSRRLRRTSQAATPSALRKRKHDSEEQYDEVDESGSPGNDIRNFSKRAKTNAHSQHQQMSSTRAAERNSAARTSREQRKRSRADDDDEDEEEDDEPPRAYRPRKKLRTVGPGVQQRSGPAARVTRSPLEPSGPSNDEVHRSTSHKTIPHKDHTEDPLETKTAKPRSSPKPPHSTTHPTNAQTTQSQPTTPQPAGLTRKRIMEDMRYIHQQEAAAKSKGLQVSALPESEILSDEQKKDRRKAARKTVCDSVMMLADWDREFKKLRTQYHRTKTAAIRLDQKRRLEKRRLREVGNDTVNAVDSRSPSKDPLVQNENISASAKSMLPTPPSADADPKTGGDAKTPDRTPRGNPREQGAKVSLNTKVVADKSADTGKDRNEEETLSAPRRDSGTAGDEDLEDPQRGANDGVNKARQLESTGSKEDADELLTAGPEESAHSPESNAATPQSQTQKQSEKDQADAPDKDRAAPTPSKTTPPNSDPTAPKTKKSPTSVKTPAPRSMLSRLEDEDRAEFSIRRARASLNPQSATPRRDRIRHDMDIINNWPLEKKAQAKAKANKDSGDVSAHDNYQPPLVRPTDSGRLSH